MMRYKLLGNSGLRVSELCLGTMTFGQEWGWGADKEQCQKIFNAYIEAGGNFIDTANRYTEGTSERFVGEFIAADRDKYVLATKYTLFDHRDDPNASGNHRKNMVRSLEASLKRLNTDYIDLFWVHAYDPTTPTEEVMRGLDDLVRAGKILYIGISDTPAWVVSRANMLAELRGWTPFVGLQVQYSLVQRTPERALLPMARALDLGVTTWGVLGSGVLTGKYNQNKDAEGRATLGGDIEQHQLDIAQVVVDIAADLGCEASQVAISWVRQQPGVMIPMLGATRVGQMHVNLAALNVTLSEDQLARLNEASQIDLGFPRGFLQSDGVRDLIYGGTYDQIDNHRT